jgi:DNA-binding PadR family transcriptional regulator
MKDLTLQEQSILLTILQLDKGAYLLSIRDRIKDLTGTEYALGTIYVPLERMRRLGYLHSRLVKPAPRVGGRSTKYYSLTSEGMAALSRMKSIQDRLWLGFAKPSVSK